jgi:hypothetical protein
MVIFRIIKISHTNSVQVTPMGTGRKGGNGVT